MEEKNDYDTSSSSTTNWSIAGGSLEKSVTFESSLALITGDNGDGGDADAVHSALKSPLILCPTSPDTAPCEITITFAQKHELRQIYVRSTARVFEIYYAPSLQSINEYLCTVRCGVATRDEEVLQTMNTEEGALTQPKETDTSQNAGSISCGSNASTNEDDWIEVKANNTSTVDKGNGSLSSNLDETAQDFYEATAEISDANSCISITLRLLSLQDKGRVFIDEIYIFADPVDSDESDNQSDQIGNSGGSTLMAMLAPTLLQLSKTTGLRQIQNAHVFDSCEKEKTLESGSSTNGSLNFANRIRQEEKSSSTNELEVKLLEAVEVPGKTALDEVHSHVSDTESKQGQSHVHVESVLDQLVSRLSRVEDLLSSFEEKMLKPISNIDTRLQRVEQQLEELTKKGQNPGLPSGTRYYAPEFSCCDSDPHSSYNIEKEPVSPDSPVSHGKGFSSYPPNDMDHSVNAAQPFPSLVVTAPDFPIAADDEEDQAVVIDSPKVKRKNAVSIDEALASALSGFLCSTSAESQKYTQALAIKAPEFSNEDDGGSNCKALPKPPVETLSSLTSCTDAAIGMDCTKDLSPISTKCSLEGSGEVICCSSDENFNREAKEVDEQCNPQEEKVSGSEINGIDRNIDQAKHEMEKEELENSEGSKKSNENSVLEETKILNQFLKDQDCDESDPTQEGVAENSGLKAEAIKEGSSGGILRDVLELSRTSSVVDFGSPILDVKFISGNNSNIRSPLEALLSDMSAADHEYDSAERGGNSLQIGEQSDLIPVLDEEETNHVTGSILPIDENFYSISSVPLNTESEELQDYHAHIDQGSSPESLI